MWTAHCWRQWSYCLGTVLLLIQSEICITFLGSSIILWSYLAYGQLKRCLFSMWTAWSPVFLILYLQVDALKISAGYDVLHYPESLSEIFLNQILSHFDYPEIQHLYKWAQFSWCSLIYFYLIFTATIPESEEKSGFLLSQLLADVVLGHRSFNSRSHVLLNHCSLSKHLACPPPCGRHRAVLVR